MLNNLWARCGLCSVPNRLLAVPLVPVGMCGGFGLSDPCGQNVARDSPLVAKSKNISGPVAVVSRTPVAYLPPPLVPISVCGGVRPLQTDRVLVSYEEQEF